MIIDELELDKKFRGMISHLMLGCECDIKKEDFDKIIENCIKITKEKIIEAKIEENKYRLKTKIYPHAKDRQIKIRINEINENKKYV